MSVGTFVQPNYESQTGSDYKISIDNSIAVLSRCGAMFAVHEQSTPNMTVRVDAGALLIDNVLTDVSGQNSGTITAPTVHPRIDRVVLNKTTGVVSVITGVESASPIAPSITSGNVPLARVALATSTTAITNSIITDERFPGAFGASITKAIINDFAHPVGSVVMYIIPINPSIILEVGTWTQVAVGQMLVGFKSGDSDFGTAEGTGGSKTKNLVHTHAGGNHSHGINLTGSPTSSAGSDVYGFINTSTDNSGTTGSGSSATQDILPPYFTVYVWKRIA